MLCRSSQLKRAQLMCKKSQEGTTAHKQKRMDNEEHQKQGCVLVLPSQQHFAELFGGLQLEDDASVELAIPGQDKPVRLNKFVLANTSDLLRAVLFKNADCAWLRVFDANARPIKAEWVTQSADPATEGAAAKTVLELCSGRRVSVDAHTAAATIAIMNALSLSGIEVTSQLMEWMKEQVARNVEVGVRMVRECAMFESLYTKNNNAGMAMELAKHALTRESMKNWNAAVEDELMELPQAFVLTALAAHLCSTHDKFTVLRRYIKYNESNLSRESKRELLLQCNMMKLDGKDVKHLYKLDVLSAKELNRVLYAVVEQQVKDLQESEKKRREQDKRLEPIVKHLEQQAHRLPAETLILLLKCQVSAQALNLSCENLGTMKSLMFRFTFFTNKNQPTGNELGAEGARELSEALKTNTTLQSLNLRGEQEESEEDG